MHQKGLDKRDDNDHSKGSEGVARGESQGLGGPSGGQPT